MANLHEQLREKTYALYADTRAAYSEKDFRRLLRDIENIKRIIERLIEE